MLKTWRTYKYAWQYIQLYLSLGTKLFFLHIFKRIKYGGQFAVVSMITEQVRVEDNLTVNCKKCLELAPVINFISGQRGLVT